MGNTINLFKNSRDTIDVVADQVIFFEGQTRDFMYIVVEGQVDLWNGDHLIETVEAGGIFGEMALITRAKRTATAIARTDAKLVALDEGRFAFMIQQTPNFALNMMQILTERVLTAHGQKLAV